MQIKSGLKAVTAGVLLAAIMAPILSIGTYGGVMLFGWALDSDSDWVFILFYVCIMVIMFAVFMLMLMLADTAPGRASASMREEHLTDLVFAAVSFWPIWIVIGGMNIETTVTVLGGLFLLPMILYRFGD